jgi:hypothetical protein
VRRRPASMGHSRSPHKTEDVNGGVNQLNLLRRVPSVKNMRSEVAVHQYLVQFRIHRLRDLPVSDKAKKVTLHVEAGFNDNHHQNRHACVEGDPSSSPSGSSSSSSLSSPSVTWHPRAQPEGVTFYSQQNTTQDSTGYMGGRTSNEGGEGREGREAGEGEGGEGGEAGDGRNGREGREGTLLEFVLVSPRRVMDISVIGKVRCDIYFYGFKWLYISQ